MGDIEAEILEIVDAGAAHTDCVDRVRKRRGRVRAGMRGLCRVRWHEAKPKIIRWRARRGKSGVECGDGEFR